MGDIYNDKRNQGFKADKISLASTTHAGIISNLQMLKKFYKTC